MAITEGSVLHPLMALEAGANATWFTSRLDPHAARKRWIASMKPCGEVTLDAGAAQAMADGRSLLPVGVIAAHGSFGRGDPVVIRDPQGATLGQGLSRYTAEETR